jgi:hypothetical protein
VNRQQFMELARDTISSLDGVSSVEPYRVDPDLWDLRVTFPDGVSMDLRVVLTAPKQDGAR